MFVGAVGHFGVIWGDLGLDEEHDDFLVGLLVLLMEASTLGLGLGILVGRWRLFGLERRHRRGWLYPASEPLEDREARCKET